MAPDAVITASLGVASSFTRDCTPVELVKFADIALYAAKHNGRNRVCPPLAGEPEVAADAGRERRDRAA